MSESLIRGALLRALAEADPSAILREEFPLCRGRGRADCVCINGALAGFEIKSEDDSLARLPQQFPLYESIFDYCYVIAAPKHLIGVLEIVPEHWGIRVATIHNDDAAIHDVRKARRNKATSLPAIVRLMWKPEIVKALRCLGEDVDSDTSIADLWESLESYPRSKIWQFAIDALKSRGSWPAALRHAQDDGSQPIEAIA